MVHIIDIGNNGNGKRKKHIKMKKNVFFIAILPLILVLISFNQEIKIWENKDFETAIDNYCKYVDSTSYKKNFDYIYVKATKKNNRVEFIIYLSGGSYDFIEKKERIIDFFSYKGHDILLIGDFPNEVVNIKKNNSLNVLEDVVKKRYHVDYDKFIQEKFAPAPLIYDYMNMTLIFKNDKLVSCKRQYY